MKISSGCIFVAALYAIFLMTPPAFAGDDVKPAEPLTPTAFYIADATQVRLLDIATAEIVWQVDVGGATVHETKSGILVMDDSAVRRYARDGFEQSYIVAQEEGSTAMTVQGEDCWWEVQEHCVTKFDAMGQVRKVPTAGVADLVISEGCWWVFDDNPGHPCVTKYLNDGTEVIKINTIGFSDIVVGGECFWIIDDNPGHPCVTKYLNDGTEVLKVNTTGTPSVIDSGGCWYVIDDNPGHPCVTKYAMDGTEIIKINTIGTPEVVVEGDCFWVIEDFCVTKYDKYGEAIFKENTFGRPKIIVDGGCWWVFDEFCVIKFLDDGTEVRKVSTAAEPQVVVKGGCWWVIDNNESHPCITKYLDDGSEVLKVNTTGPGSVTVTDTCWFVTDTECVRKYDMDGNLESKQQLLVAPDPIRPEITATLATDGDNYYIIEDGFTRAYDLKTSELVVSIATAGRATLYFADGHFVYRDDVSVGVHSSHSGAQYAVYATVGRAAMTPSQAGGLASDVPERGAQSGVLLESAPNPFIEAARITYYLPMAASVDIGVYSVRGALIATLTGGYRAAGPHIVTWDGRTLDGRSAPAGTYVCRITQRAHGVSDVTAHNIVRLK